MTYENNMILTLDNDKKYILVDQCLHENKKYLFLVGEEEKDLAMVIDNEGLLQAIESDEEFSKVYNMFMERNKDRVINELKDLNN